MVYYNYNPDHEEFRTPTWTSKLRRVFRHVFPTTGVSPTFPPWQRGQTKTRASSHTLLQRSQEHRKSFVTCCFGQVNSCYRGATPKANFTRSVSYGQKTWLPKGMNGKVIKNPRFSWLRQVKKNSWNKSLVDNQKSDTPKPQSRKKNTFPFMLRILRNSNLLRLTYSVKPSKSLPIWFFNAGKCICLFKILTTALHMAKNCLVFYNLFINAGLALTIHIQILQKK